MHMQYQRSYQIRSQFRIGPRVGVAVNDLHFNKSVFDGDNRAGFTAGVMTEFTVPVIGLGFDLSAMYVRRSAKWMDGMQYQRSYQIRSSNF